MNSRDLIENYISGKTMMTRDEVVDNLLETLEKMKTDPSNKEMYMCHTVSLMEVLGLDSEETHALGSRLIYINNLNRVKDL